VLEGSSGAIYRTFLVFVAAERQALLCYRLIPQLAGLTINY